MKFLERVIMGMRYHRRAHIAIIILTVLFTTAGLFLQTNLMLENQARMTFNQRLNQLSIGTDSGTGRMPSAGKQAANGTSGSAAGANTNGTTGTPQTGLPGKHPTVIKKGVAKRIAKIYQSQTNLYQLIFWLSTGVFIIEIMFIAFRLARRNRDETRALMLVGKHPGTIAFQSGAESFISFGGTFAIVTLISLLFSTQIMKVMQHLNRTTFIQVLTSATGKSQTAVENSLSSMFHNHMTDFTSRSLLVGHDFGNRTLDSLSGYSITFLIGATIVILLPFLATLLQAHRVRRAL